MRAPDRRHDVGAARDPIDAFRAAMESAGLKPPSEILADGKIHRFSPDARRDDAGWYVAHLDGTPAGAFGNWRDGLVQAWCAKHERELSPPSVRPGPSVSRR